MQTAESLVSVRRADLSGGDADDVGRLVAAYLMQTEREKALHLAGADADGELPERYREEVESPARAYEDAVVYIAEVDEIAVGVVVVQQGSAAREIKRVWVDPDARGRHIGSALLDTALSASDLPVRLTVWDWRDGAVQLYRSRGFVPVASWEDRARLLCMERPPHSAVDARLPG